MTAGVSYYFGDKAFYRKVLAVAVPIMIQNGISNFVNLLDNIMVGSIGTEEMSAVAIVNKLMFVYILCLFGGCAGIGIFTAQFYGKGDGEGVRNTFRLKILNNLCLLLIGLTVFSLFGEKLISLYLHEGSDTGDLAKTFTLAREYLSVVMIGMIPQAFAESYAGTLRETEHTTLPMIAGMSAVFTNLFLNYILIFGHFGAPALGVKGAAIATVIAKFTELAILVAAAHTRHDKFPFFRGVYRSFRLSGAFVRRVLAKSLPLLVNEMMWSTGVAALAFCYSLKGLAVVAGYNISSTVSDIFNVATLALGNAIAIIVGNLLGANRMKEAKQTDARLIVFTLLISMALCVILFFLAPVFPLLFSGTDALSRAYASSFLRIYAFYLIVNAVASACYFTLRSGGKTIITFLFDSVYMIGVCFPFTYVLARFTPVSVELLYALSLGIEIIKVFVGLAIVGSGRWMQNIVGTENG